VAALRSAQAAAWSARAALPRVATWLLHHPLALCLPVQAGLLLTDLGRLPLWGDEQASLDRAALPLDALARALQSNVHPTLFFLTLRAWLSFPCQGDPIVCARALSALFVIATTIAIDRFWLRRLDAPTRAWFLALWTLSPALLLYGRMARSYAMQLLLVTLALEAGRRYAARPSIGHLAAYCAAALALLYTHYLPAIAVVASVTLVMLWQRRRDRRGLVAALLPLPILAVGLTGWVSAFATALGRVGTAAPYRVLGDPGLDVVAALAYTFIAFAIGEAVQVWMLAALALLALPIAVLAFYGIGQRPPWLAFVAPAAVIAFVGAHQWVSYAFVAARLLFLLPFALLLLVTGGRRRPRLRAAVCAALVVLALAGIHSYFRQSGFLNKAYVVPVADIAQMIRDAPGGGAALVIVDHHSFNLNVISRDFQPRTVQLCDQPSFDDVVRQARDHDGPVWFVRGTHDISPQGWNGRVEEALHPSFAIRRTQFAPYSTLDRWLMELAGWRERPTHAVEVLEMRRRVPVG
jgi:hypothetical protein